MRVAITDSGVGGLSVCAAVEAGLRSRAPQADLEVIYLNAAVEDDYAYNAMATRREQLLTFDRFLDAVAAHYAPDILFIACNTLAMLFRDPLFARHDRFPVIGIIETGVAEIMAAHEAAPEAGIAVFATPVTVDSNGYRDHLLAAGIAPGKVVQQACPGLPDAISNDVSGEAAAALLATFVPEAVARFAARPDQLLAFLGCTHFGYQASRFEAALEREVADVRIVDPNAAAAAVILRHIEQGASGEVGGGEPSFEFVSRYPVPERPLRSLARYLGDRAPATLGALERHRPQPDLFGRVDERARA